ncbi:Low affinity immunoglobulin epsilon Fc [Desmophyllum pertusum]|uniref:Low affinity immunoglobulin epsilon Fc n=1 Tax=Desmophyllum pertusum TaxID=174260 RepID=A0A9W9ZXW5_9CNID|nr:Low affinity immunoglobulin epsilon Fc [Desmophyllum pertusum]
MQRICPNNWVDMQFSCYKFVSKALNWTAAKSACETLGSKLVVIKSQAEQQALGSKIPDTQFTWIGLYRDPKDKNRWLWVDGTSPNFTHWNTGEPIAMFRRSVHLCYKRCMDGDGTTEDVQILSLTFVKLLLVSQKTPGGTPI